MSDLPTETSSRSGDDSDEGAGVELQGVDTEGWTLVPTSFNSETTIKLEGVPQRFSYNELSDATGAFCEESKLGHGGFGTVYRGVLPSDSLVAVKRMNSSAQSQGTKEFKHEISILAQLRHKNLVELQGWCADRAKKEYLLVYELMPNGSLDDVLFSPTEGKTSLSWPQRFKILTGTAAALEYLHQGWKRQVIHRDIKCSNIMLDEDWTAKLGDFGIARLIDYERGAASTNMARTFGYMAPEVFSDFTFTEKADVYAFGVVLLEIACGRKVFPRNSHQKALVPWVRDNHRKGAVLRVVDKRLNDYDTHQMEVVLQVGLLCTQENPAARPSMRSVVQVLGRDVEGSAIEVGNSTSIVVRTKNLAQRFSSLMYSRPADPLLEGWKEIHMYRSTGSSDSTRAFTVKTSITGTSSDSYAMISRKPGREDKLSNTTDKSDGFLDVKLQQSTMGDPHKHDAVSEDLQVNSRPDELPAGGTLHSNEALVSRKEEYTFVNREDGNLVTYNKYHQATWASGTGPGRLNRGDLELLMDGNLVLFDTEGTRKPVWASMSQGIERDIGPYKLIMQDDGNLVIYGASMRATWASRTLDTTSGLFTSMAGKVEMPSGVTWLRPFDTLVSRNRMYTFLNQVDGNLCIYNRTGGCIWTSQTSNHGVGNLYMQRDGNLVLYNTDGDGANPGASMWCSGTCERSIGPYKLIMQDDGTLMINDALGKPIWATNSVVWSGLPADDTKPSLEARPELPVRDTLPCGDVLQTFQYLVSWNGMYTFVNQGDGNLCIYKKSGECIWDSGTYGQGVGNLHLEKDGNLVLYRRDGTENQTNPGSRTWSSGVRKSTGPCLKLIMQDDGNLVVYDTSHYPIWAANFF